MKTVIKMYVEKGLLFPGEENEAEKIRRKRKKQGSEPHPTYPG